MKHVIIGGSDAGISAALRIKELAPDHHVTLLLADEYPNYSICGIPFFLSREVKQWSDLAHRKQADLEAVGIQVRTSYRATHIDTRQQAVYCSARAFPYDKLLIGTGASSTRPPISGLDQPGLARPGLARPGLARPGLARPGLARPGIFTLRWIDEMLAIDAYIEQHSVQSVVVVGGGYIGVELADALTLRGLKVTLVEYAPTVLQTLDAELGTLLQRHMEERGVSVLTQTQVQTIEPVEGTRQLNVVGSPSFAHTTDLVLVVTGAQPTTELAQSIGLATGINGAIPVNRRMETSLPNVFAAGDCAETYHRLLETNDYLPLGTTAHKQGRVAGENMMGGRAEFQGSLGTQVVKVFDRVAARTGLHDRDAVRYGIPHRTAQSVFDDHKAYYPGAKKLTLRLTGHPETGELLGAQIVGHTGSEVAKRVDVFATALFHRMRVAELSDLDLSYSPPLSSPWDPVQMAAQAWNKA